MAADLRDVAIVGGTGYVAGELLRLLAGHPVFSVRCAASTTQAGGAVTEAFPHLRGTRVSELRFAGLEALLDAVTPGRPLGVFTATPHGTAAEIVDRLLDAAARRDAVVRVVDLSADFRFRDPATFQRIYGRPHGAPARLADFVAAVPEHFAGVPAAHAAQPGCFTTAVVMGARPFLEAGLVEESVFAAAVTGSSGSGRTPAANTHHPERDGNLYAYAPLAHRHEAEMRMLLASACGGREPDVEFVPHSGPFVRGIHATLRFVLRAPARAADLVDLVNRSPAAGPFLHATEAPPRLTEVTGTNRCRLGVAVRDRTLVVMSVIDNLVKGAAGGGVQWMNRLAGLPDATGLDTPGFGWI